MTSRNPARPNRRHYRRLARLRYLLRRFLAFSEEAVRAAGLAPRQHQAILAVKGFARGEEVTVHDLAGQLCIRHHSTVELVDRPAAAGLVIRRHDPANRRCVLLSLTDAAETPLADLSATHLEELQGLRPALAEILDLLGAVRRS